MTSLLSTTSSTGALGAERLKVSILFIWSLIKILEVSVNLSKHLLLLNVDETLSILLIYRPTANDFYLHCGVVRNI